MESTRSWIQPSLREQGSRIRSKRCSSPSSFLRQILETCQATTLGSVGRLGKERLACLSFAPEALALVLGARAAEQVLGAVGQARAAGEGAGEPPEKAQGVGLRAGLPALRGRARGGGRVPLLVRAPGGPGARAALALALGVGGEPVRGSGRGHGEQHGAPMGARLPSGIASPPWRAR